MPRQSMEVYLRCAFAAAVGASKKKPAREGGLFHFVSIVQIS